MKVSFRLLAAAALCALPARAAWPQAQPPVPIDENSIEITELGRSVVQSDVPPPGPPEPELPVNIDQIINIAAKLWDVIQENKAVVDVKPQYAVAVPSGTIHWTQLSGWQPPKGVIYGFSAKNLYGAKVIDVRYQVMRNYGGSYKGKGRYLSAVTIEPLSVQVAWGYKFSLSVDIPDSGILNMGSQENPVAGMSVTLNWKIQALNASEGRAVYFLQGDGTFQEVGGPFRRRFADRLPGLLRAPLRFP